jgi:nucleoside-diphosphate-sugar epimerase
MTIVVTGATGFLGRHICSRLIQLGESVVALGRDREKGAILEQSGARFFPFDLVLDDTSRLASDIDTADSLVHAAALSSNWGSRAAFLAANVYGTKQAIALSRAISAKRFVFLSSPSVTFRFADQFDVVERTPLPPPVNAYAESKGLAETLVRAAVDLSPIILRPRAIYGAGDTALLPRLIRAAQRGALPLLRDGKAVTNLTHVDDAANAVLAALSAPVHCGGRTYNIASPDVIEVREIIESACRKASIPVRWRRVSWPLARTLVRLGEYRSLLTPGRPEPAVTLYSLGILAFSQTLDISAAATDLGFGPETGFSDGLAKTFRGGGF